MGKDHKVAYLVMLPLLLATITSGMLLGKHSVDYQVFWKAVSRGISNAISVIWMFMFLTYAKPLKICSIWFIRTIALLGTIITILHFLTLTGYDGKPLIYLLSCAFLSVLILYYYICHNKGNFKR